MKRPIIAVAIVVAAAVAFAQEKKERKSYAEPPKMAIDVNKKYTATIDPDKGPVVVELFAKEAPKTVNNFVVLARDGFYDGTILHRVIPGFMVQGGDPTGTGRGGTGVEFEDETAKDKIAHVFLEGILY